MAKSFRLMQRFWLDLEKADEYELAESIQVLKDERSFSRAIRQSLRLWISLRHRDTSVLFELFPWIGQALGVPKEPASGNYDDQINALQSKIDMLTDLLLQKASSDKTQIAHEETRKLPAPKKYGEPEIEITAAKIDENNRSDWNFAISSAATVYGNFDSLPPKIIEYGLRTGRIPADKVKPQKPAGPKVMDVQKFTAPQIDVDNIQW